VVERTGVVQAAAGVDVAPRTFASWVAPIATSLAEDRAEVIAFARQAPAEFWSQPSDVQGWTRHDILAHLAGGNDQMVQMVVRAVAEGSPLSAQDLDPDTDSANAAGVEGRRSWPVERLIAELEVGGEEMQELLAALRAEHEQVRPGGVSYTLGDLLRIVLRERHDAAHLDQLRSGQA
jgi:uncharacterized protein (TIGR03083 family)